MTILRDLIFDYTLRNVALGSALLGIVSGVLGPTPSCAARGYWGTRWRTPRCPASASPSC